MAATGWLKYIYLSRASQPKSERPLYRMVKGHKVCRIVEVGIGSLRRSTRLVEVAQRYAGGEEVAYTGLDWFDTRSKDQESLTLKAAHVHLQKTEAKVRLVPGPPARALASVANAHRGTGLLLISSAVADLDLEAAWFYVPRMLTPRSLVLREQVDPQGVSSFTQLSLDQIAQWVGRTGNRRAA